MKKEINLSAQKTEHEWLESIDEFWLKNTPKWFEFLNWIVLLSIFYFLAKQTGDWKILIIFGISFVSLWQFLGSYFYNIHIKGIPFIKNERAERLFSLLIGAIISTGIILLLNDVLPKISGKV